MSPLYRKLLLWFCAANIAVLLVSVFVTDQIGRHVSLSEPDWDELAAETLAAYENHGLLGLAAVTEQLRRKQHVDATLYRNGENLLQRRPAPPLRPFLPQLLSAETRALKAGEGLWLASRTLTTAQGERLQFVAWRGPMPPHVRRDLLLTVQIVLSLAVIAALGFVLARSLTAPIAAIQSATRRMAGGDLTARADAATVARRARRAGPRLQRHGAAHRDARAAAAHGPAGRQSRAALAARAPTRAARTDAAPRER